MTYEEKLKELFHDGPHPLNKEKRRGRPSDE